VTAAEAPAPGPRTITVAAPPGSRSPGYDRGFWGMATLIATEGTIFLALLSSYFWLRASSERWPPLGTELPDLSARTWIFTGLLLGSSIPIFFADAAIERGSTAGLKAGLALSFTMGLAFLVNTFFDFQALEFGWDTHAYGSIFYVTVGLHALHVAAGLVFSLVIQAKAWLGFFDEENHAAVQVYSLYWHFVDGVWIFVFSSLFLSAHIR